MAAPLVELNDFIMISIFISLHLQTTTAERVDYPRNTSNTTTEAYTVIVIGPDHL